MDEKFGLLYVKGVTPRKGNEGGTFVSLFFKKKKKKEFWLLYHRVQRRGQSPTDVIYPPRD